MPFKEVPPSEIPPALLEPVSNKLDATALSSALPFPKTEGEFELKDEVAPHQPLRQFGASYTDLALVPPKAPLPLPGFVYMLPAMAEGAMNYVRGELSSAGVPEDSPLGQLQKKHLPPLPVPSTYYQDIMASGLKQSEELTGAVPPRNTLEMAARNAAIVPGLSRLPFAAKALVPALQSKSTIGKLGELALTAGIGDVLSNANDPSYKSIGEMITDDGTPPSAVGVLDTRGALPLSQPADELTTSAILTGTVWGGLAAIAGTSALRAMQASKRLQQMIDASETIGKRDTDPSLLATDISAGRLTVPVTENVPRKTAIASDLIDRDASMFRVLEQAGLRDATIAPAARDAVNKWWLSTTQQPLAARMESIIETGQLPNGTRTIPLKTHYQQLSRLTPQQLAEYNDMRNYNTILDSMIIRNQPLWFGKSAGDLRAKLNRGMSDPTISKLVNESHQFYRDFLSYMKDGGIIDQRTYNDYVSRTYSPTQAMDEGTVARVMKGRNYDGGKFLLERELDIAPKEFAPTAVVDFQWVNNMTRLVERNAARREVIDLFSNLQSPSGTRLARRGTLDDNAIVVVRNGKREAWHITDPVLDHVVRILPEARLGAVGRTLAAGARVGETMTTGLLNPAFTANAIVYDAFSALTNIRSGMAGGVVDEALKRTTGYTLGDAGIPRADVVTMAPAGLARRLYGEGIQAMSSAVNDSLARGGALARILGPQKMQQLADIMTDAVFNSSVGMMKQYGADSAQFLDTTPGTTRLAAVASKTVPEFVGKYDPSFSGQLKSNPFWRTYTGLLSAMHKSTKTQFFGANIERQMVVERVPFGNGTIPLVRWKSTMSDEAMRNVAVQARRMAGDTSRVVGSSSTDLGIATQKLSRISMWGPISIQAGREFGRAVRDHPFRTGVALTALGAAAIHNINSLSPEARDEYLNKWTPEQRARMMIVEVDGMPMAVEPVEPLLRPFMSVVVEGYRAIANNPELQRLFNETMTDDLTKADDTLAETSRMLQDPIVQQNFASGVGSTVQGLIPPPFSAGTDNPLVQAALTAIQYGSSNIKRFSTARFGQPSTFQHQDGSDPFDPANPTTRDFANAMVEDLLVGAGRATVEMLNATTYPHQNMTAKFNAVADAGSSRFQQPSTRGFYNLLLPPGDPQRLSAYTSEAKLLAAGRNTLQDIAKIYDAQTGAIETQVQGAAGGTRLRMEPIAPLPPQLVQAAGIGKVANNQIARAYQATTGLLRRQQELKNNYKIPASTKVVMMNNLTEQIAKSRAEMYRFYRQFEEHVQAMGYRDFNDLHDQLLGAKVPSQLEAVSNNPIPQE